MILETTLMSDRRRWPQLVGTDGQEAVRIIKQETGNIFMLFTYRTLFEKLK